MENRKRQSLEQDIEPNGHKRIRIEGPDVLTPARNREIEVLQMFDFNNIYENVQFTKVMTLDQYRKLRPYKVFHYPGKSKVDIAFHLNIDGTCHLGAVIVGLNHCATNCHGVVDMFVNGRPFLMAYNKTNSDNFEEQIFRIQPDLCVPGTNVFTVVLNGSSPGVYWLSEARIVIEKIF